MSMAADRLTALAFLEQPPSAVGIQARIRDELIVSYAEIDGHFVALSKFADDEWLLNPRTTNATKASSRLRFGSIPQPFRETLKAIFYRYLRHGRKNSGRPATSTAVRLLAYMPGFLRHLQKLGISKLADVTPMACSSYVQLCKHFISERGEKPLSNDTLLQRFLSVEYLHELSHFTDDPMPLHPWPGSSATRLAGYGGMNNKARFGSGKTPVIPDDVFCALFKRAWSIVESGDALLDLRDELDHIEAQRSDQHLSTIARAKIVRLEAFGLTGGLEPFNKAIRNLRTACYIVIASVSGCRNHELAFVKSDAWSREHDDEGNELFWMHSRSTKTGAGDTQWLVPEAAKIALEIMTRWAAPYQAQLKEELAERRRKNPRDPQINEAEMHVECVFLGVVENTGGEIRTLSLGGWNRQLKRFARECGIEWDLASHQFRRKFANYAARSRFGDLRYLRKHFKHWSMDMTLGYALNGYIEMELYLDIGAEYDLLKEEVAAAWMQTGSRLSGGYGRNLIAWRGERPITLFKSHAQLVRSIAHSTAIRSNGHAFCTADDGLCVGNDLEKTRCGGCNNAVIGVEHKHVYEGLRSHLLEVQTCDDIGDAGRARVQRDLERCDEVLKDLGHVG